MSTRLSLLFAILITSVLGISLLLIASVALAESAYEDESGAQSESTIQAYQKATSASVESNAHVEDLFVHDQQTEQTSLVSDRLVSDTDSIVYLPAISILPAPLYADDMILIPAGEFQMGCDSSKYACSADNVPLHTVYLSDYYIDMYEVSNWQYSICVVKGACTEPHSERSGTRYSYYSTSFYGNYPVVNVDWYQAWSYCIWDGKRLPTEAEWEKAARGVSDTRNYPWGDAAPTCDLVNGSINEETPWELCVGDTTDAGSYPAGASPYGVMDMSGNVWEWVFDWYDVGYYSVSPYINPTGPAAGAFRSRRGGA